MHVYIQKQEIWGWQLFSITNILAIKLQHYHRWRCCKLYAYFAFLLFVLITVCIYPTPLHDTRSIFKWSLPGLNSVFLLLDQLSYHAWLKSLVFATNLPIAGERIVGFKPFARILALCEMQTALSKIWTLVAMSISSDHDHYAENTSL